MERIIGLVKILFAEFLLVFFLPGALGNLVVFTGIPGCPGDRSDFSVLTVLLGGGVGLVAGYWLVTSILHPCLRAEEYRSVIRIGSIPLPNPSVGPVSFPMCSTHPSYALVDLLMAGVGVLLFALIPGQPGCTDLFAETRGVGAIFLGLTIPLLRLGSWYGLHRQVAPEDRQGAWVPVAFLYGILTLIGLVTWFASR